MVISGFLLNYLDVVFLRVWDEVMCVSIVAVFDKNANSEAPLQIISDNGAQGSLFLTRMSQ